MTLVGGIAVVVALGLVSSADAAEAEAPLVRNRETWERVIEALETGKMPPHGAPAPSADERQGLLDALDQAIGIDRFATSDGPLNELAA